MGEFFVKYSALKNKENFMKAVDDKFVEIKINDEAYHEKCRQIDDWKMSKVVKEIRALEEEKRNK